MQLRKNFLFASLAAAVFMVAPSPGSSGQGVYPDHGHHADAGLLYDGAGMGVSVAVDAAELDARVLQNLAALNRV